MTQISVNFPEFSELYLHYVIRYMNLRLGTFTYFKVLFSSCVNVVLLPALYQNSNNCEKRLFKRYII